MLVTSTPVTTSTPEMSTACTWRGVSSAASSASASEASVRTRGVESASDPPDCCVEAARADAMRADATPGDASRDGS